MHFITFYIESMPGNKKIGSEKNNDDKFVKKKHKKT